MIKEGPSFPALGFYPDVGPAAVAGREKFSLLWSGEDFSSCDSWDLKYGKRLGMLVVDRHCRAWRVASVVDLGIIGSFWERVLRFVLQQSMHALSQELVVVEAFSLEQIKKRVCASIQGNPDDWRDDELIAGEAGPPRDEQELLDEMCAAVRGAGSLIQLINALYEEAIEE